MVTCPILSNALWNRLYVNEPSHKRPWKRAAAGRHSVVVFRQLDNYISSEELKEASQHSSTLPDSLHSSLHVRRCLLFSVEKKDTSNNLSLSWSYLPMTEQRQPASTKAIATHEDFTLVNSRRSNNVVQCSQCGQQDRQGTNHRCRYGVCHSTSPSDWCWLSLLPGNRFSLSAEASNFDSVSKWLLWEGQMAIMGEYVGLNEE